MDRIIEKKKVPKHENSVGIRATLNNMGISDNSIGYNNESKTVTINGKSFMKPDYIDEEKGISYAPESEIRRNLVGFYKNDKNPVVRVSDSFSGAAGRYGIDSSALSYGDGTVMIGGKPLDILYIDDEGKAWAWQNDVYDSVERYADSMGLNSPERLAENYNRAHLDDIYDMLNGIYKRKDFSYDPDNDPVFQSYREKYLQEGDRAGRNAIADYSALTGGYVNSSAITAGALSNQYYAQQLSNKIPELAESAYKRYTDSYQTDLNTVAQLLSAYDKGFDNTMSANNASRNYANETSRSIVERDKNEWEKMQNAAERQQEYNAKAQDIYWTDALNKQIYADNNNKLQSGMLDIKEKEMFLEYYRRILESELRESDARIYSAYN